MEKLLDTSFLRPGMRLGVGLSGGADSVALVCALALRAHELGLVLHAIHLHHGLRGAEADEDAAFVQRLAANLGLRCHIERADTAQEARQAGHGIEETARRLRYAWFERLMAAGVVDAVATAHTLDDQAETVLAKLLRGAWTEGLAGIFPVVHADAGMILRPMLAIRRSQIEAWLSERGQPWREDSTNRELVYTRNRIRHQLLPDLESWNPRVREHLAQMAELAREEESWWQAELARLAPLLIQSGKPVRGGGRAADDHAVAMDVLRLASQPIALQRRILRHAASLLGAAPGFEATEKLRHLALKGRPGEQTQLASPIQSGPILAQRTARELRLSHGTTRARSQDKSKRMESVQLPIPGHAEAFGWHFLAHANATLPPAIIRPWRPGDRVTLRYSSGPRKVKEVLERMKITGDQRADWPVLEWNGQILWMQGAELVPAPTWLLKVTPIE
uniref:tRNA(Ile)-lysidine synthetase n=1 Tax=mine drainage metagenome TaxID=410659 RepID=E6QIW9_9ZZZZ